MERKRDDNPPAKTAMKTGRDSNPDPITGEPGAHPVGVGAGSAGGAAAGAAVGGAVGGPIGAAVGGVVGAVAGGYAGKGVAEMVDPTEENRYWSSEYKNRPYYKAGSNYEQYEPAYRYGWESASKPDYQGKRFEDVEPHLENNWSTFRGTSQSNWRDNRDATRDAYNRVFTRSTAGVTQGSDLGRSRH